MVATAHIADTAQIIPSYSTGSTNVTSSSNTWFLGPTQVFNGNGIDRFIRFCVAQGYVQYTHRQTDYATLRYM